MILTITLNPLLEKVLYFDKVDRNKVNRAKSVKINAGGKGINVSRQLNKFKIDNVATGFLGGENGKRLRSILYKEEIKNSFQQISDETREGIVIVEDTIFIESYFFPNPIVKSNEVDALIEKTKKAILNCEMIIFSGSSPLFEKPEDELKIFNELIPFAKENDKFVLIDIYGPHLSSVLKLQPDIVHSNLEELENSIGIKIENEYQLQDKLKEFYSLGIKIFILTDGDKKFYAINHGFIYEIIPPKVETRNPTGSGDAFMAGFIYGLHHNLPFDEMLLWATASGAANASMIEVCSSDIKLIETLKEKTIVKKLN